jgi:hypothetical protein
MTKTIKGTFSITSTPEPTDEALRAMGGIRMLFEKNFEGPLTATSIVSMMGLMNRERGSGGYVALEKVSGRLEGKQGTFCLQHSSKMIRGVSSQSITVIADSATDGLEGLRGEMVIDVVDGQHFYTFDYNFTE